MPCRIVKYTLLTYLRQGNNNKVYILKLPSHLCSQLQWISVTLMADKCITRHKALHVSFGALHKLLCIKNAHCGKAHQNMYFTTWYRNVKVIKKITPMCIFICVYWSLLPQIWKYLFAGFHSPIVCIDDTIEINTNVI